MRRYYLHSRNGVFYAELVDPVTGKKLPARSTFQKNRDDALGVVHDWLRDGVPEKRGSARPIAQHFDSARLIDQLKHQQLTTSDCQRIVEVLVKRGHLASATLASTPGSKLFSSYLTRFWTFAESPYVKEKTAHGQRIGEAHCVRSMTRARKYWLPFLKDKRLADVTRDDLKAFSLDLASPDKKLSAASRNAVLVVGTTALRWAHDNNLIPTDLTKGVRR
jgi:hypothetical protein